jgi:hypothetical protein
VIVAADRACRGTFDLLGYRDLHFGDPIDWSLDPVSGRRAPAVHWSRIDPLDGQTVGDSKVIWELNRHQWLVHAAITWQLTHHDRCAEAVVAHIEDWIEKNPTGIGINWASSLEIAFRLIAWSWSVLLIRDAAAVTPEWFARFEDALREHATHVERFLSLYFSPNTHLTGEALGLLYAAVLLPDAPRAEHWRTTARRILETEISRQVRADGVYFEQSTCYQRYTIDIYLHFLILAKRAGIGVAPHVERIVKSMLDVLIALRQPDGVMPGIGDEDGGMLLPLGVRQRGDCASTFSTAAVLFNEPRFAWAAKSLAPETLWLSGANARAAFETIEQKPPQPEAMQVFPEGGYVVMRSGRDRNAHMLTFDAGPLGCDHSSGHGHADLLSVQCSAFGQPYIVDAGTYCYTADSEWRQHFRTTAAHNTIIVDGLSQVEPAGPFSWKQRCAARLLQTTMKDSIAFAEAEHDAYRDITHRRRIFFIDSRYWILIDDLSGNGAHRIDLRFQFAPMDVRIEGDCVRATRDGRTGLLLRSFATTSAPHPAFGHLLPASGAKVDVHSPSPRGSGERVAKPGEGRSIPMQCEIRDSWIAPDYGRKEQAPAVVWSAETQLPLRILTFIVPAESI